jgi:Domain of unknown function (4846)
MKTKFLISIPLIFIFSVYGLKQHSNIGIQKIFIKSQTIINPSGKTILERINVPEGFERIPLDENSFGFYLRNLPLKPDGTGVFLYNGEPKTNKVHVAVIDMDIGYQDLQQCADAVIRLRAEYLYAKKLYGLIHFKFTNGFRADYAKWALGYRIDVNGNEVKWVKTADRSYEYKIFRMYLNVVFTYAGTYSLAQELVKAEYKDIQSGDIFIRGGSPGHAVIVVDVAVNKSTGKKIFLLAQSYMPAQDIHVLMNPADLQLSPWYEVDLTAEKIITPEWEFTNEELRRFP